MRATDNRHQMATSRQFGRSENQWSRRDHDFTWLINFTLFPSSYIRPKTCHQKNSGKQEARRVEKIRDSPIRIPNGKRLHKDRGRQRMIEREEAATFGTRGVICMRDTGRCLPSNFAPIRDRTSNSPSWLATEYERSRQGKDANRWIDWNPMGWYSILRLGQGESMAIETRYLVNIFPLLNTHTHTHTHEIT